MKIVSAFILLSALMVCCSSDDVDEPSACTAGEKRDCTCPDGSKGHKVCSEDGATWGDCICSDAGASDQAECGSEPLSIGDSFKTEVAEIEYNQVQVKVEHKRDVDEYEDGCITRIEMTFLLDGECPLRAIAKDGLGVNGGIAIQDLSFTANSFCPQFPDSAEGKYVIIDDMELKEITPWDPEVPDYNSAESCLDSTVTLVLEGIVKTEGGKELIIEHTEISVSGEFLSEGDTSASCPK